MTKEHFKNKLELENLATGLASTFFQRRDLYARQLDDGSYICIRKPLETSHLIAHLEGEITLGTYVLDLSSHARYIVFDADDETQFEKLINLHCSLATQGAPSYLEESRRGGHIWLLFSTPLSGKDARLFGKRLSEKCHLDGVEIFPKQDKLASGPGSLVRLPFGIHRKTGMRYGFITPDRQPIAGSPLDQYRILSTPERMSEGFIKSKMTRSSSSVNRTVSEGVQQPTMTWSGRDPYQPAFRGCPTA